MTDSDNRLREVRKRICKASDLNDEKLQSSRIFANMLLALEMLEVEVRQNKMDFDAHIQGTKP